MPFILGIDEAGRGPILGPLVIAGAYLDEGVQEGLARSGVRDSKKFSGKSARARRAELAVLVRQRAQAVAVRVVSPAEIDARNLGDIERDAARSILAEIRPEGTVIADGTSIFGRLAREIPGFVAEDKADARHLSVAAASIVAKDERDRLLAGILARYEPDFGPIAGSGYPNPATMAFLAAYRARHGDLPPEARRKWNVRTFA